MAGRFWSVGVIAAALSLGISLGSAWALPECSPQTGHIDCDDGDPCTADVCVKGGLGEKVCENHTLTCDDGNSCTADSCDPQLGCVNVATTCDDGKVCTTDACDPATGDCTHELIMPPALDPDALMCTIDEMMTEMMAGQ